MKLKCFVLLFFLGACGPGPSLTVSSIDESKVKSYSVSRRKDYGDLFTVKMKDGHFCSSKHQLWQWCRGLNAAEQSWQNGSCSCTCLQGTLCFVPSLKTCISAIVAHKFGGEYV